MGRLPCCEKVGLNKGRWSAEEDEIFLGYIRAHGEGSWHSLPKNAGLLRCGKSCRLRWVNYLKENLKRGNITQEEEETIIKLQASVGNRWSAIAAALPGRTDNEIKNHWNAHLIKKAKGCSPETSGAAGRITAISTKLKQKRSTEAVARRKKKACKTPNSKGGGDQTVHHDSTQVEPLITIETSSITVEEVLEIVYAGEQTPHVHPRTVGAEQRPVEQSGPTSSASSAAGPAAGEHGCLRSCGDPRNVGGEEESSLEWWDGLKDIAWEEDWDVVWQSLCRGEGNSEEENARLVVLDGKDMIECNLERWLLSDNF